MRFHRVDEQCQFEGPSVNLPRHPFPAAQSVTPVQMVASGDLAPHDAVRAGAPTLGEGQAALQPVPAGEQLADAIRRVALGAAAVVAATAFSSPAEEVEQKWRKAAYRLISLTAPELALTHHSRFATPNPDALVTTAALQLQTIGGKTGAGATSAALFLEDWQQYLQSRGDTFGELFPIDRCDLETMAQQFTAAGSATKSTRIAPALALLRKLGCLHVPFPDGFVIPGAPPTKKAVAPPGARNPPTPLMVLSMERCARDVTEILSNGFSEFGRSTVTTVYRSECR